MWPRPAVGSLPVPIVIAAARGLQGRLLDLGRAAASVEANSRDRVIQLIGRRLEAWAATVAILDAERLAREQGVDLDSGTAIDAALDAADACDVALDSLGPALTNATVGETVRRWRSALAPPYRDRPPWWLGGE